MVLQVLDDTLVTHQQLTNPAASAPTAAASATSSLLTPAAGPSDSTAATSPPASAAAAVSPLRGTHPTPTPEPSGLAVSSSPKLALSTSPAADFPPGRLSVQHEAPWNLRKLQQGRSPSDSTFAYTNRGTGVHVYMLDTVGPYSCTCNIAALSNSDLPALSPCTQSDGQQQRKH